MYLSCSVPIHVPGAENLLGCPARATAGSAGSVLGPASGKALLSWPALCGGQQGWPSCWRGWGTLAATGARGEEKWMSGRHANREVSIWQRQMGSCTLAVTHGQLVGGLHNALLHLPSR